jgi:hypothetical protein
MVSMVSTTNTVVWETTKSTSTRREIACCRKCNRVATQVVAQTTERTLRSDMIGEVSRKVTREGNAPRGMECCGRSWDFHRVQGAKNTTKCGARCRNSKGHVCECECGGKNHGCGHDAEAAA